MSLQKARVVVDLFAFHSGSTLPLYKSLMAQKNILHKTKWKKTNKKTNKPKALLLQGIITFHSRKDMIISDLVIIIIIIKKTN